MSFVSYAQNFEDVVLWRALKHIQNGFYIDVGANDPSVDSVTKAFYERDWHGLNIEPLAAHYEDLVRERPRDQNIRSAVGDHEGTIDLWEADTRGWATAAPDVIENHSTSGHSGAFQQVPLRTLSSICDEHAPYDIHFLKVDVEGLEEAVLRGADFSRHRPWIVVVEATRPNSTVEVHAEWEPILLENEYAFVYADGLNRYYLADEHRDLTSFFKYPPNTFDDFITVALAQSIADGQKAHIRALQLQEQLKSVYDSRSWKITAPLRALKRLIYG